jgi:hypothetical protein
MPTRLPHHPLRVDQLVDLPLDLLAIVAQIHEMTSPDGDGGRKVTPRELGKLLGLLVAGAGHVAPLVEGLRR